MMRVASAKCLDFLRVGGLSAAFLEEVYQSFVATRAATFPHPAQLDHLPAMGSWQMGGRNFEMIAAPGHSDGQVMFYAASEQLMLAGDHVLMGITPNIGLWGRTVPNPLGNFLASLADLERYAVRLGLAGHKASISDWRGRFQELAQHHQHRLVQPCRLWRERQTAQAIVPQLFEAERFTVHEWRFAVAETLAHLEYLRQQGQVTRQGQDVWHYQLA